LRNPEITYNNFIDKISGLGRKDIIYGFISAAAGLFSVFIFLFLIIVTAEVLIGFSALTRKVIFYLFPIALIISLITLCIYFYYRYRNLKSYSSIRKYALLIGNHFSGIRDNLLNAVEIFTNRSKRSELFSDSLSSGLMNQVAEKSDRINFKDVVTFRKIRTGLIMMVFMTVASGFVFRIFTDPYTSALDRLLNYNYTYIDNSLGVTFEVSPGNTEIAGGSALEINAKVNFTDPAYITDEVVLNIKELSTDGIELNSLSHHLRSHSVNQFRHKLTSVNRDMIYWFEYRGVRSSEYNIKVVSRPVIKHTRIIVHPPSYTRLPSRETQGPEITVIRGTRIEVESEFYGDISKASIQSERSGNINMNIDGQYVRASFNALSDMRFSVVLTGRNNITNPNPETYILKVIPDEYPEIFITEPEESEKNVQGMKEIMLRSRISDDFGFTRLRLAYRISGSKYGQIQQDFSYIDIPVKNTDANGLEVPYLWNISTLNLAMEDEVEYYMEVYDNDNVSGPKVAKSHLKKLVYPSLEALMKKTEEVTQDLEAVLKSAFDDITELNNELDEIKQKLEDNPEELGLNDPVKNKHLQQKLENIQNSISTTRQKLDELVNELNQSGQISKQTLEKYMELQQLFQKIDSQELREALKKLQEAFKNLNRDELREAMKNFKFDEENFRKSIEKTMELLNKILNEQKFGELALKLDELTRRQDLIKEESKKNNSPDKMNELSSLQEQLRKELQEFQNQFTELTENMKKYGDKQLSRDMQKMLENMQKKQLEKQMEEASESLKGKNKQGSSKQQNQLSRDLNELNQQMQQMLQDMLDRENSALQMKMEEFLERLKELSEKQQELKEQSEKLDMNSKPREFQENQRSQEDLKNQLSNLIEDIMSLSPQTGPNPMMSKNLGDAYNEMDKASDKLGKKDPRGANQSQTKAKEHLDKAIDRMEQMCQSGMSGKGKKPSMSLQQLLQQLQQMIQRQQGLNQQLQGMPNGNQGQFSQEQMAQMQRLALEQEQIRRELSGMNEEVKKQQEIEGKKMLGNLDQIQKDMMEVIKNLQENNISPETRKRQEKILQRLLDFQLSAREKDFEQKRESRPGKNFERLSPEEVVISRPNIINGINRDALELKYESYSDDYQMIIMKYMEQMRNYMR